MHLLYNAHLFARRIGLRMAEHTKNWWFQLLGVTIAFTLASGLMILFFFVTAQLFGRPAMATQDVASWSQLSGTLVAICALSGALVDLIRFLAGQAWHKKMKFGIKFAKLLRTNLA